MDRFPSFDPDGPGINNGHLFGLPHAVEEARVVVIPVPWDATVSYREGTAKGPEAILAASLQVDLYDSEVPNAWEAGIAMLELPFEIQALNQQARPLAISVIEDLENGFEPNPDDPRLQKVNAASQQVNQWVAQKARQILDQDQIPMVLGGEHSSPLGLLEELARQYDDFGILQIDAHLDLREAYEGFTYSHASIMWHASQLPAISRLVQVGVRDVGTGEMQLVNESGGRSIAFPARTLARERFEGKSWQAQVQEIVRELPEYVYISFDIDGLDPSLCPATGTPVPGGFSFEEALFLIDTLAASGRTIIGLDLCEVAPGTDEWNAIVGARVLYRLFTATIQSIGPL